jgi:tetratricopeptide (TPR) repeat protein
LTRAARFAAASLNIYRTYPPSSALVSALDEMGQIQYAAKQFPDAIASFSEAARLANSLQGNARSVLPKIYAVLGDSQRQAFDLVGAEKSLRQALEAARSLNGDEHQDVLQTKYYLGLFLCQTARPREGLKLLQASVDLAIRTKGPDEGFHVPMVRRAYGVNLLQYGRVEDGLTPLTESVETTRRVKRAGTRNFADALALGSEGETTLGNYTKAEAMLREASAIHARLGSTSASGQLNTTQLMWAKLLISTGRANEAAKSLRDLNVKPAASGGLSSAWLGVSAALAEAAVAVGEYDAAIRQAGEVRKAIEASPLRPYLKRYEAQAALQEGRGLLQSGRAADALPLLQRAVQLGSEVYDPDRSPVLADSQVALASCLLESGRRDQARALLAQARAIYSTHPALGEQFRKPLRQLEARLAGSK